METFLFFPLRFRQAYDYAYDSDFRFSLGHKPYYDSDYDSDSDSVASENQPFALNQLAKSLKSTNYSRDMNFFFGSEIFNNKLYNSCKAI